VSKYESELRRRLESGADIEETARWFIDCVIKHRMEWKDLSVLEVRFMKYYRECFNRWMAKRKLH
jgi:hypothetical protein